MSLVLPRSVHKVEVVHPDNLPDATDEHLLGALHKLVHETDAGEGGTEDLSKTIHTHMHTVPTHPWLGKFIPGLENLAARHHVGNFVVLRETGETFFESMPIYARIGMHLLFYGKLETKLLQSKMVEHKLKEQSIKEGRVFERPSSISSIPSFVKTYNIDVGELLIEDIKTGYRNFNEFFYRKLKPTARPIKHADKPHVFCSAADCRLTVYETIDAARKFWVKGRNFTVSALLAAHLPPKPDAPIPDHAVFEEPSLALFRLAPADYHRFHAPADVIVGERVDVEGQYYTVNPQAVNEEGFDVFTANRRAILYLTHEHTGKPIAFVAVGALLVGSIRWSVKKGDRVKKGEELGYFAYGGSTVIVLFTNGLIKFDDDLVETSKKTLETLVKVGDTLGVLPETS